MQFQNNHHADHVDHVELTPPTSRTAQQQEMRRLSIVVVLSAILLGLSLLASSHVEVICHLLFGYQLIAL